MKEPPLPPLEGCRPPVFANMRKTIIKSTLGVKICQNTRAARGYPRGGYPRGGVRGRVFNHYKYNGFSVYESRNAIYTSISAPMDAGTLVFEAFGRRCAIEYCIYKHFCAR